ncbi:MAG: hypothetical protein IJT02_04920 [Synergistaceae bacterium]|nr:hypothetical protein [Synergistaceae bacterium]
MSTKLKVLLLALMIVGAGCFYADASPSGETIRLLERNTAVHWGQDCFVWVVHYPEEIAGVWAEAEAARTGMSDAERERYRRNFVSELQLDKSETFLVSVYSFGARPVNLSPVKDNVSLLAATGERVKPSRYDNSLDNPSGGVVQGLVFFPKQGSKDYVIALRGMDSEERLFSFAPPEAPAPAKKADDVVVVTLPPKKQVKKAPVVPAKKKPVTPPPPVVPQKPIPQIFQDDSKDIAEFVRMIHSKDALAAVQTPPVPQARPANVDSSYVSRESVLRKFLSLWADNRADEMYAMLSDASKRNISRENFAKEVAKDSALRQGLKSDYRIDWIGEERAKVITTRKTLVFKQVLTRTLGVTREGSSWRVVW